MSLDKSKLNKDTFCIAPWTEIHFGVGKEILPCCIYEQGNPLGLLSETDDVKKIYNSKNSKKLRKDLFNGVQVKECSNCWNVESNTNAQSYRQWHNKIYSDYVDGVLENTNKNFTLKKVIARRLDIRFDNKCNLKCRICSSKFSTSWYSDEVKLGLQPEKKSEVYKKTISSKVFDFIIEQLPNVNELFFAGGEPIIQDGHYAILEKAIELGISEKISLAYNTNFSTLKYKNKNIISIWDKFKEVNIGASLDGNLEQGEYQRKNIIWKEVEKNIFSIRNKKRINFKLIPTLSIFNVYNLPKFHRQWVDKKYLKIEEVKITILKGPELYDIKNLPEHHRKNIIKKYKFHIDWLEKNNGHDCIAEYQKVISYLESSTYEFSLLEDFVNHTEKLDKIRNENFYEIYPEFEDLRWYVRFHKISDYEKELKNVIEGYNQSILNHRETEHKNVLKISMHENYIKDLERGAEESEKYIKNLEMWLETLKTENKQLKDKIKLKENKLI